MLETRVFQTGFATTVTQSKQTQQQQQNTDSLFVLKYFEYLHIHYKISGDETQV
jgi:hypothetical protein